MAKKVVKLQLKDLDDTALLKLQAAYETKMLETIETLEAYETAIKFLQAESCRRGIRVGHKIPQC